MSSDKMATRHMAATKDGIHLEVNSECHVCLKSSEALIDEHRRLFYVTGGENQGSDENVDFTSSPQRAAGLI